MNKVESNRKPERLSVILPDPSAMDLAINMFTAQRGEKPPYVTIKAGVVENLGDTNFSSHISRLEYPLLTNATRRKDSIKALKKYSKISFVDNNAFKEVKKMLISEGYKENLRLSYLYRKVNPEERFATLNRQLNIVNITSVNGKEFEKGLSDFIKVYKSTREITANNEANINERLEHLKEYMCPQSSTLAFVGYYKENAVSCGSIYPMTIDGQDIYYLGDLNTIPSEQHKGFGGEMLGYRLEEIKKRNPNAIAVGSIVSGNTYSLKNMQNFGFNKWFDITCLQRS